MNAYDQIPYSNLPDATSHPGRLFVLAKLAGLNPASVECCRVLELGTNEGANLVGLAVVLPETELTGIDLAAEPVARGQQTVSALGLRNVRLLQMDLLDITADFGKFDYIIAHGLYSWTPEPVRDKILAIARACLSPQGVAMVSYNAQPGGHIRELLREMLLYHTERRGPTGSPAEQLENAREMLRVLAFGPPKPNAFDAAASLRAQELLKRTDSALYHDDLAPIYAPAYFHEFASHAANHGLQYAGDASDLDAARDLKPESLAWARSAASGDRIAQEQYLDFLRMRRFRHSLLCHQEFQLAGAWDAARIEGCHAASIALEQPDGAFVHLGGARMTTTHPAPIEYLRTLIAAWPQSRPVIAADAEVAMELFKVGMIELHSFPSPAVRAGEKPLASPLARYQAQNGETGVTTLWHRRLGIDGPESARLITLLDGTRGRAEIMDSMKCSSDFLEETLAIISRHGLLLG